MYLNDKLPQGETETKVDPYTLPALIAWLRTKPVDETYNYGNPCRCVFAQYGEQLGLGRGAEAFLRAIQGFGVKDSAGNDIEPFFGVVTGLPRTFGDALARAEALAREAP